MQFKSNRNVVIIIKLILVLSIVLGIVYFCETANAHKGHRVLLTIDEQLEDVPLPNYCSYMITSGYRTKEKNKEVGGARHSYHLTDRARDLVTYNSRNRKWKGCRETFIKYAICKDLTVLVYKSHLHVDNRKNQKCYIIKRGKYEPCPRNYWCQ